MDRWMDGWMNGWMDRWMDEWIDGWMDGFSSFPSIKTKDKNTHPNSSNVVFH
jgi:hypothetical protein